MNNNDERDYVEEAASRTLLREGDRTAADVLPGTRWKSAWSGRVMVVLAVRDGEARMAYVDDLTDQAWNDRDKVADLFEFAGTGPAPDARTRGTSAAPLGTPR